MKAPGPRVRRSLIAAPWLALFLCHLGCSAVSPSILSRERHFRDSDYARYRGLGTAEISGQAIARGRGGVAVIAADDSVYLFPATPYSEEWWQRTMIEGEYLTESDPRSLAFMRAGAADEEGRFRFRSLPAGEYYLVCIVTWHAGEEGSPLQVANLGAKVHLEPGGTADVKLETVSRHRTLIDPPPAPPEER